MLICGVMPFVFMFSPRTLPVFVYGMYISFMNMFVVSRRDIGMMVNLPMFVCIFHLCS